MKRMSMDNNCGITIIKTPRPRPSSKPGGATIKDVAPNARSEKGVP